jgi:hypothetical protein
MHAVKMALMVALVGFGLTTGAIAQTSADSRATDRRAAANALAAFSDALRGETNTYKQARMLAGAEFLRQSPGFIAGNRYLTNAYYTALYGRDSDIRSARDWLNSFLIVGSYRFRIMNQDTAKVWAAIYKLMDFENQALQPSTLTEALNSVRDTAAFGNGHVRLAEAVNRIGSALEKRNRGSWWIPFTARFDARRAQNALREALRGY